MTRNGDGPVHRFRGFMPSAPASAFCLNLLLSSLLMITDTCVRVFLGGCYSRVRVLVYGEPCAYHTRVVSK
jgi:hypothetical protein